MTNPALKKIVKKILVIDTDPKIFEALEEDFGSKNIMWAKNGESGLEMARNKMPQFVITEVSGPNINGFDIVKNLKTGSQTSKIKFVMVSETGSQCNDDDFLNALGIEKFLVKSNYSPIDLTKEIEKAF